MTPTKEEDDDEFRPGPANDLVVAVLAETLARIAVSIAQTMHFWFIVACIWRDYLVGLFAGVEIGAARRPGKDR